MIQNEPIRPRRPVQLANLFGHPPSLEGVPPGGPAIDPATGFDYTPKETPKKQRSGKTRSSAA